MKTPAILIMEDDEILCDTIAGILRDENYSVDTVGDGLAGLKLMNTKSYSLLLMDLKMPHADGYDVLKQAKSDFPTVKVIVMTGSLLNMDDSCEGHMLFSEIASDKRLTIKSADAILQKPFDIEKLLDCVKTYIAPE